MLSLGWIVFPHSSISIMLNFSLNLWNCTKQANRIILEFFFSTLRDSLISNNTCGRDHFGQKFLPKIASLICMFVCMYVCVTVCLCWRCTRAGTTSDPNVILLHWVFWVQGDLILFITGVGSARWHLWVVVLALLVLRPLCGQITKLLGG